MKGKQKVSQNLGAEKYGKENSYSIDSINSSEIIQIELKNPTDEKTAKKTESNQNNKKINNQINDYKTLYQNLKEEHNNLKKELKEKETKYNNEIISLKENLKNNENKYIEELNKYKELLENKNNSANIYFSNTNPKNHKTIRDKYIKNRGSENNEVKEKAENQVILLTKQIEKLEKDLKAKDDEKNKILKEKNILKQKYESNLKAMNKLDKENHLLLIDFKNTSNYQEATILSLKDEIKKKNEDNEKLNEE